MKKIDIEQIQTQLEEIKAYMDKQDYNSSTYINQRIIKIRPILEAEIRRMDRDDIEVHTPKILIFTNREAKQNKKTVQEYMNYKLHELVINDYKIIDYGKLDEAYEDDNTRTIYLFIKYTS